MKLFRLSILLGGAGLLAAGLGGCLSAPEFSTTPEISFDNITLQRLAPKVSGGIPRDSIRITVRYQDGDGDLGLSAAELTLPQYKFPGKFSKNFFIEPFVKNPGSKVYVSTVSLGTTTAAAYDGTFGHLTSLTDSKSAPIKGTITYAPIAFNLGTPFVPGQKVKFQVSIADRALHVSNTIMTDSVVIGPR
ncbi:MAG: hypothetical protein ACRYFX_00455 [Janthinobacterium lividum]